MSRRTSLTRPNGVNTSYGYDSLSHLLSVLHQTGTNTLDGASYTYAGNRKTKTNYLDGVTSDYGYDLLYQLTQVTQGASTTESYTYDAVGNRLSSLGVPNYNYNASNELTSSTSGSYTYDNNGNTLTDANGKSYTWDYENRLTQVVVPGTNGGTTTFKYDPFGRRIQKSGPLGTTNYIYDAATTLEELDSSGNASVRYTQSLGIDQPLAVLTAGVANYYQQDAISSVTAITKSAGVLTGSYVYDSYGNSARSTGSLTNALEYAGRDVDRETGLYYNRARYYDPTDGRFLSEDPMSFWAGMNFYDYGRNRPSTFVDPFGLVNETFNVDRQNHGWGPFLSGDTWFNGAGDPPGVYVACKCAGDGKYKMSISIDWDIHIRFGTQSQLPEENEHAQIVENYMNSRKPFYEQQYESTVYSSEAECNKARHKLQDDILHNLMQDLHQVNLRERQAESFWSNLMNGLLNFLTK